jgi:hypothetical protein
LTRVEHLGLLSAGLGSVDALGEAPLDELAERLGGDEERAGAPYGGWPARCVRPNSRQQTVLGSSSKASARAGDRG